MMGKDTEMQCQFMFVNLDEFVPHDHLLRSIKKVIDFTFIYDKVKNLYSPLGRRSIDPVLLIKMLLLGYLYGIPSERKLEQEVKLNLAYRWFLGLDLAAPIPDHSTFSQNRRRRFKRSAIFQDIFDVIVSRCIEEGLVTGEVIITDSTHIKASASRSKIEKVMVKKTPSEYLASLEQEAQRLEDELQKQREVNGEKKREKKVSRTERSVIKEVIKSTTDPDAGLLNRPNKPSGFHYLSHNSIDTKHGIITDVHVTSGNTNDHVPYLERIKRQQDKFQLQINKVGADKGYSRPEVHCGLEKLGIEGYLPPVEEGFGSDVIDKKEFAYSLETDTFTCPERKQLAFARTARSYVKNQIGKVYAARTKDCKECPRREHCFGKTARHREIYVTLFRDTIERNKVRAYTPEYYRIQRLRRIWCEGTFGLQKEHHNLQKTYKRGIENVREQCLLSALAINIKRIIRLAVV